MHFHKIDIESDGTLRYVDTQLVHSEHQILKLY